MTSNVTIDYLKALFREKYGEAIFLNLPVTVKVSLTYEQYDSLGKDLISITNDDSEIDLTKITIINIPNLCQFVVGLGDAFEFTLTDNNEEPGTEEL